MELISPESTREDITEIYHDMNQLQKLPGEMLCDEEREAHICQEILDSVKECLWHKQFPALLVEEPRSSPASIPRLDPQTKYNAWNYATYDRFRDVKQGSCEEALAVARDVHQWVLAAAAMLKDKIEGMSCSLSCSHQCFRSCRHSGSCWQRSCTMGHQTKVPQVVSHHGDPARR